MIIAGGENIFPSNIQQAAELGQGSALVVVHVTKPQPNRVALVMKFRLTRPSRFNKCNDLVHLFFAGRHQTGRPLILVDNAGLGFLVNEIDDLIEHG